MVNKNFQLIISVFLGSHIRMTQNLRSDRVANLDLGLPLHESNWGYNNE